eukprot:14784103-Ditylum_brightwellii.AAC.1
MENTLSTLDNKALIASASYPINVPKPSWRPKTPSVWVENSKEIEDDNYRYIFEENIGQSLRSIDSSQPEDVTVYKYDPVKDKAELEKNLTLDTSITPSLRSRVVDFVIEFWDVFREVGVSTPVKGYELVIDTGDHQPIAVKKPHYGIHETPIMEKTIQQLLDKNISCLIPHLHGDFGSP